MSASRSAVCREGRRSSLSIFLIAASEQPTRSASACCVRSSALRCRRIQYPNEAVVSISYLTHRQFCLPICRPYCISNGDQSQLDSCLNRSTIMRVTTSRPLWAVLLERAASEWQRQQEGGRGEP